MRVRFVCNLPGAEPGLTRLLQEGVTVRESIGEIVEADPSWHQVGRNLIGPPRGPAPIEGDVGIYEIVETGVIRPPNRAWVDRMKHLADEAKQEGLTELTVILHTWIGAELTGISGHLAAHVQDWAAEALKILEGIRARSN